MRRVLLLLLVGGVAVSAWHVWPDRQTRDVPVPPDDASPRAVVAAYVEAIDAHDCGTVRDLSVDGSDVWCRGLGGLRLVESSEMASTRSDTSTAVDAVIDVEYAWWGGDRSMEEGESGWTYYLRRASPTGPWRIADQGVG